MKNTNIADLPKDKILEILVTKEPLGLTSRVLPSYQKGLLEFTSKDTLNERSVLSVYLIPDDVDFEDVDWDGALTEIRCWEGDIILWEE